MVVVCSVASAVVVGVMLFALYILCGKVKTEKEIKQIEKEVKEKEDLQNLRFEEISVIYMGCLSESMKMTKGL